jgi:hypothetical protein
VLGRKPLSRMVGLSLTVMFLNALVCQSYGTIGLLKYSHGVLDFLTGKAGGM